VTAAFAPRVRGVALLLAAGLAARASAQVEVELALRADQHGGGPPALVWARDHLPHFAPGLADPRAALRVRLHAGGISAEPGADRPDDPYLRGRIVAPGGDALAVRCDATGYETWEGSAAAAAGCPQVLALLAATDAARPAGALTWVDFAALLGNLTAGVELDSPVGLLLALGGAECGDLVLRAAARGDRFTLEGRSRGGVVFPAILLALAAPRGDASAAEEQRWIALAFAARDARREEAAMQLARFGSREGERCLRALLHAGLDTRLRAIEALARRGAAEALPDVVAASRRDAASAAAAAAALAALWDRCPEPTRARVRAEVADEPQLASTLARVDAAPRVAGPGAVRAPGRAAGRPVLAAVLAVLAVGLLLRVLRPVQRIS